MLFILEVKNIELMKSLQLRKQILSTAWPNKNASILFGIIFQKLIHENENLFHNNN